MFTFEKWSGIAALVVAGLTAAFAVSLSHAQRVPKVISPGSVRAVFGRTGTPVRLDLQTFHCINADEDSVVSDGDEPFLLPVAVYVDGNTVRLSTLSTSTAFLQRAPRAHGNLNRNHVRGGERFAIPSDTGRFATNISLIDTGGLANPKTSTQVGILVVACEQDGTANSVINAGYATLVSTLQAELNNAIRSLSNPDIAQIQNKIRSAVTAKMTKQTIKSMNIMGAIDPDGIVGAQYAQFTYAQLEAAGPSGLSIAMDFNDTSEGVHYRIEGRASFPPVARNSTVGVTINRVRAIDDLEGFGAGDPDFKARITVDRNVYNTPERTGTTISPNWNTSRATTNNPVQILIELFEVDSTSADERCDINPRAGVKPLNLFIDTATGRITGDVTGMRGVPITVRGAGDSDKCEITFTVNAT